MPRRCPSFVGRRLACRRGNGDEDVMATRKGNGFGSLPQGGEGGPLAVDEDAPSVIEEVAAW